MHMGQCIFVHLNENILPTLGVNSKYAKKYIGVCMVKSQLIVNCIPDHAAKH